MFWLETVKALTIPHIKVADSFLWKPHSPIFTLIFLIDGSLKQAKKPTEYQMTSEYTYAEVSQSETEVAKQSEL